LNRYKDFAKIYDELINTDIDYKRWANVILELSKELNVNFEDYLDIACGTGNLTKELCIDFKNTWAVDLSVEMLTEAEAKLRTENKRAKFICQDITELQLNRKFDLVTCCLDSTNYIIDKEQLELYFSGVYNHLKENGVFIFDINSYYKLTEVLGDNVFTYDSEDVVYVWENSLEDDIVNMYLTFFIKQDEFYRRFDEEHEERAYKEESIEYFLHKVGFSIIKKLDNYEYKDVRKNTERIVYVLKK
jgi:SAM-dependent methyltransferase